MVIHRQIDLSTVGWLTPWEISRMKSQTQTPSTSRPTSYGGGPCSGTATSSIIPGPMLAVPVPPIEEDDDTHPDGGTRAWVVIFGATISMAATYGLMTGVGIFQVYWKENQLRSFSTTYIAWITSVFGFLAILLAGPVGVLFDRWGARKLLFLSGAVYFAAFLGLAFSWKYEHFMGCFIVAGISVGKLFLYSYFRAMVSVPLSIGIPSH